MKRNEIGLAMMVFLAGSSLVIAFAPDWMTAVYLILTAVLFVSGTIILRKL